LHRTGEVVSGLLWPTGDDRTILLATTALFGWNPVLCAIPGVDSVGDFTNLGAIAQLANILSVTPSRVQATTIAGFIGTAEMHDRLRTAFARPMAMQRAYPGRQSTS